MARTERHLSRDDRLTDGEVRDRDEVVVVPDTDPTVVDHRDERVVYSKTEDDRTIHDPDVRRRIVQEELVRHGVVQPRQFGNVPATAGLTLGLAACAVGWVPALFPFAAVFAVVGLFLSMAGKKRAAADERTGRGRAAAGILFSLIGIGLAVLGGLITFDVINSLDGTVADAWDQIKEFDTDFSQ
jgi:hypothetical protein